MKLWVDMMKLKVKREKFDGVLEEFNIPRKDAEDLIMRARKKFLIFNNEFRG